MGDFLQSLWEIFNQSTISSDADGSLWIHSAPGRYAAYLLAFLIVAPLSFYLWRRKILGHLAPGIFFASFLVPLLVVPCIACESIHASAKELAVRTGFWFAPTLHNYPLEGLERIQEERIQVRQRVFERTDLRWKFHWSDGRRKTLKLGDLFDANREPVIEYFEKQGVRVLRAN